MQIKINFSLISVKKEIFKFLFIFSISIFVLYTLSILYESYIPLFNMQATASTLHYFLQVSGLNAAIARSSIGFDDFTFLIIRQCTGILEVIAVSSAIIAFPTPLMNRLKGIAISLPIIYLANMTRLFFLAYLGIFNFQLLEIVHDFILQFTFISFVIFIWFFWLKKVVNVDDR